MSNDTVKNFGKVNYMTAMKFLKEFKANETWLNLEEAAMHLNVSKDTLRGWIREREANGFPAYRAGKLWRFKAAELDEWVKRDGK